MCSFAGRKILQRLLQGRTRRKGSRNPVRLQAPRLRARLAGVPTKVILHHRDTEAQSNTKRKRSSVPPCLSDGPASPAPGRHLHFDSAPYGPIAPTSPLFPRPCTMALHSNATEDVMIPALAELEPKPVWKHFDALAAIPRASTKEAAAREYVLAQAARDRK